MQRVKLYRLNEDGEWDDRGTGRIRMDYVEQSEEIGIHVIDEDDKTTLLVHRISAENVYKKDGDSIIQWSDHKNQLALSFEETVGCTNLWNHISSMQRILHFNSLNSETSDNVISESKELPGVNRDNLPLILKVVTENIKDPLQLSGLILKDVNFFEKLMDVFEDCEKRNDVHGLRMMFDIVKGIISLNSIQILEKILGDQLFMKIIGCLEYDPDVPQSQQHRTFFREHVVFKEAIQIQNPLLVSKIHQTYRVGYLKDVLTNVLDDTTSTNLKSIIDANNATVVTLLKDDIQDLFARLRSPSTSEESRTNLVHFLHDFCSLSKGLRFSQKASALRNLVNKGIFDIISEVLKSPDKELVLMGTDILLAQEINSLCSYIVQSETPFLGLLVKGMMVDYGDKMEWQFVNIFQNILEYGGKHQKAILLDIFCEKHLPEFVDFIAASCPERPGDTSEGSSVRVGSHPGVKSEVLLHICEVLCTCIQLSFQPASSRTNVHLLTAASSFIHNNVTEKVLLLTRRKEKPLVAAAVRFVRRLLTVRKNDIQSYFVENNTLKPIIDVFVANGHYDNLVTSAILELLEYIRKKRDTLLLKYVVDTFWDQLAPFEHLTCIQDLRRKYDKCLESPNDPVDMIVDEEKPAASCSSSQRRRSGGLVDYEDDEDDDEDDDDEEDDEEDEQGESKRRRLSSTSEEGSEAKGPDQL